MLTVYTAPETRGEIAIWFLKELRIPHEVKTLDYKGGEHKKPWFLKLNPFHMLPTIQDGDFVLYESGAVLIYLQNKYAGPLSNEELGLVSQWILFANATLSALYSQPEELQVLLSELEPVLEGVEFIVGNRFTGADVALASYLLHIPEFNPEIKLWKWPNIYNYISRMAAREACTGTYMLQKEEAEDAG